MMPSKNALCRLALLGSRLFRDGLVERQLREIGLEVGAQPEAADVGMDHLLQRLRLVLGLLLRLADDHRQAGEDLSAGPDRGRTSPCGP